MAHSMVWLLVVWSVLTTVLVVLLIYRSTLTMHEDDQLFLGEAEAHLEKEQHDLMLKVDRITPMCACWEQARFYLSWSSLESLCTRV